MRAISLTQPWASLVAIGAKQWETRSWPTSYRGQIAIHAAKNYPKDCRELEYEPTFLDALKRGIGEGAHALPTASIIAIGYLIDCAETRRFFRDDDPSAIDRPNAIRVPESELVFGAYGDGRYAFRIADIMALPKPVPCRGALGIWVVPDDAAAAVSMQLTDMQHEAAVRAEARGEH